MEIKVTGCHDCPFAECDYEMTLEYWCNHFSLIGSMNVNSYNETEAIHPSCPLKQSSITVKLNDNDKTGVHKERE